MRTTAWGTILVLAAIPIVGAQTESWLAVGVVSAVALLGAFVVALGSRRLADLGGAGLDERQEAQRNARYRPVYWAVTIVLGSVLFTLVVRDVGGVTAGSIAVSALGAVFFLPVFARTLEQAKESIDAEA